MKTSLDRVAQLVDLFELTGDGPDRFVGPGGHLNLPRLFGGQVLGQGLVAATRTVHPGRPAHSLHGYFLRAGEPHTPISYRVDRVRDGRRFATRSVSAEQHGKVIATMLISFADTAGGVSHQRPAPVTAPPEQVSTLEEASRAWGGLSPGWSDFGGLEIRVDPRRLDAPTADVAQWTDTIWQRTAGPVPDDPMLHQALLTYSSDIMQLASALVPHGVPLGYEDLRASGWDGVSLDHAIWFHEPVRADEYLLFHQHSPVARSGRALTWAEVYTPAGELVASIAQEGLIFRPGELA